MPKSGEKHNNKELCRFYEIRATLKGARVNKSPVLKNGALVTES